MITKTKGPKRSLTHVGGAVTIQGDPSAGGLLGEALDVAPKTDDELSGDGPDREHVHGFHTYPARMHPTTAARLIDSFGRPGDKLLDPFCGSGTVLVMAAIAGLSAVGTDLNPLAVRLSLLKTRRRSPEECEALFDSAEAAAAFANERRTGRAGATRRFEEEDVQFFEPHVLLELDSLRAALERLPENFVRHSLLLVLSSILVKVSRKRSDTTNHAVPRRIAAGYTAKLFVKKTRELCQRLSEYASLVSPKTPDPKVSLDDATVLDTVRDASIDLIVTSPPYAATYDYLAHHQMRLRWLGISSEGLAEHELGARRRYSRLLPNEAFAEWSTEVSRMLRAQARVLRPGGLAVLLMADSAVKGGALRADELVAELAPPAGFLRIACASQERPHFHGPTAAAFATEPRREHALLLERDGS